VNLAASAIAPCSRRSASGRLPDAAMAQMALKFLF
jgi:hypothetical protein